MAPHALTHTHMPRVKCSDVEYKQMTKTITNQLKFLDDSPKVDYPEDAFFRETA